jgi:SsrA-binding protein
MPFLAWCASLFLAEARPLVCSVQAISTFVFMAKDNIHIKNRKARFNYEILETFEAGIKLQGTEIKSIRQGKASLPESYCYLNQGELYIKNMNIAEYDHGNINNHEPTRERKLLLHKRELKKLDNEVSKGNRTIIALSLYLNNKGLAKLKIALAQGKKLHDKRQSLKEKSLKREMDRAMRR